MFTKLIKMKLGKFSMSLTVKNIERSIDFYQLLGFQVIDGGHMNDHFKDTDAMKWRILENPSVTIGLFQGMFDQNILTFHPNDVMEIQKTLKKHHIDLLKRANERDTTKSIMLLDPDGNQIMLDESPVSK